MRGGEAVFPRSPEEIGVLRLSWPTLSQEVRPQAVMALKLGNSSSASKKAAPGLAPTTARRSRVGLFP